MAFTGRQSAPNGLKSPMVYRPTIEEFADFSKFVEKIEVEDEAHKAGICKIIPPKEWVPRKNGYNINDLDIVIEGPIKQKFNLVDRYLKNCYQTTSEAQPKMSVQDYYKLATSDEYKLPPRLEGNFNEIERKYWQNIKFKPPIYGCDVSQSLSDPDLEIWNLGKLDTIMKYVTEDLDTVIQGVTSPYLYFGMWKATFSWHVEDMDLYGINMIHYGKINMIIKK